MIFCYQLGSHQKGLVCRLDAVHFLTLYANANCSQHKWTHLDDLTPELLSATWLCKDSNFSCSKVVFFCHQQISFPSSNGTFRKIGLIL